MNKTSDRNGRTVERFNAPTINNPNILTSRNKLDRACAASAISGFVQGIRLNHTSYDSPNQKIYQHDLLGQDIYMYLYYSKLLEKMQLLRLTRKKCPSFIT